MSDCGDKSIEANETGASGSGLNHSNKNEKKNGEGSGSGSAPSAVSFSMSHALSMLRQRQRNLEDSKEKKDEALEIKEKAREKRRRRRKNQKLARAKFKAKQAAAELESHDLKSDNASKNAASSSAADINEGLPEEMKDCGQLSEPEIKKRKEQDNGASINHLPMKKRFMKLEAHEVVEAKQGNLNSSVLTCQETSTIELSNKLGKTNMFIPRAIMLKKKQDTK